MLDLIKIDGKAFLSSFLDDFGKQLPHSIAFQIDRLYTRLYNGNKCLHFKRCLNLQGGPLTVGGSPTSSTNNQNNEHHLGIVIESNREKHRASAQDGDQHLLLGICSSVSSIKF